MSSKRRNRNCRNSDMFWITRSRNWKETRAPGRSRLQKWRNNWTRWIKKFCIFRRWIIIWVWSWLICSWGRKAWKMTLLVKMQSIRKMRLTWICSKMTYRPAITILETSTRFSNPKYWNFSTKSIYKTKTGKKSNKWISRNSKSRKENNSREKSKDWKRILEKTWNLIKWTTKESW